MRSKIQIAVCKNEEDKVRSIIHFSRSWQITRDSAMKLDRLRRQQDYHDDKTFFDYVHVQVL